MKQDTATERFGRYSLVRRLAVGGMGELYLAEREGFAGFTKRVVVKRIREDLADDEEFVDMFLDEGRLAAMITHPNIVQIYELGQVDGQYFMAMEYVPGKNLAEILERLQGPMELRYALATLIQLCSALTAAHEAKDAKGRPLQLVHRDVSPPNVLLSYSGAVKLTDFGIAKVAMREKQTRAGVVKGKFVYLSPEQALGNPVDARADVYALGLVLFEATVGRRANPGVVEVEQVYAASQGRVLDPAEVHERYPEELRQIYYRASCVDVAQRFQSARELQQALVRFAGRHEMMVSSPQLAEYMQRLFPRDAVEAGEGDLLGERTREASAIAAVPSEELETLTDGPRNAVSKARLFPSHRGGDPFAFDGVRASDEVTTEREDEDRTRELDTGLPLEDFAVLSGPLRDEDPTLLMAASHENVASGQRSLSGSPQATPSRSAPEEEERTREVRPREALQPTPSDALDRAETLPRALDLRNPPLPEPAARSAPDAPRARSEAFEGPEEHTERGPKIRWWHKRSTVIYAAAFALLVVLAVLVGSLLAAPAEDRTENGPSTEAKP